MAWCQKHERHAALMRCRNEAYLRELLEQRLKDASSVLTDNEKGWARRQYWNDRMRDSLKARGRNSEQYAC